MPTPNTRGSYGQHYQVLDQAMMSKNGIRVGFADSGKAHQYRVRLHTARQLDRNLNKEAREPGDPGYGVSEYDCLVISIKEIDGLHWVYIKALTLPMIIEELPDDGEQDEMGSERSGDRDVSGNGSGAIDSD